MNSLLANVIENLIVALVFAVVSIISARLLLSYHRSRLYKFFGLGRSREIVVYVSSYRIEPNTVKDRNGVLRGHQGMAIPENEFHSVPILSSIFQSPSRYAPKAFAHLVDFLWVKRMPKVRFEPSPPNGYDRLSSSLICVGGPKFNSVTEFYLRTEACFFAQYKDEQAGRWRIKIIRGERTGEVVGSDLAKGEVDVGYVQRIHDTRHQTTIFILAGLGVNATLCAASLLSSEWHNLHKKFGARDFGIAFKCPDAAVQPSGHLNYTHLFSLPE